MKQVIAGSMLIGAGIALLWMFLVIYFKGKAYVWEPNEWILAVEIAMSMWFIVYGAMRAYEAIKKARGQ